VSAVRFCPWAPPFKHLEHTSGASTASIGLILIARCHPRTLRSLASLYPVPPRYLSLDQWRMVSWRLQLAYTTRLRVLGTTLSPAEGLNSWRSPDARPSVPPALFTAQVALWVRQALVSPSIAVIDAVNNRRRTAAAADTSSTVRVGCSWPTCSNPATAIPKTLHLGVGERT